MVRTTRTSHPLLDAIKNEFKLTSDAYLAKFIGVSAPTISKMRTGTLSVTADFILAVYDATDWKIERIRGYINGSNAGKQSQIFGNDDS